MLMASVVGYTHKSCSVPKRNFLVNYKQSVGKALHRRSIYSFHPAAPGSNLFTLSFMIEIMSIAQR